MLSGFEKSEFEVQFLPFEDSLGSGSMVIEGFPFEAVAWDFRIKPLVVFWMGIDHPSVVGTGTVTILIQCVSANRCFKGASPLEPVWVFAVSTKVHLVSFWADGNSVGGDGLHWKLLIVSLMGGVFVE